MTDDDTWSTRLEITEVLEAAGWEPDDENPLEVLRKNGATWALINDACDSQLTGPGGWNIEFPSDVPDVLIIAACLAATSATPAA